MRTSGHSEKIWPRDWEALAFWISFLKSVYLITWTIQKRPTLVVHKLVNFYEESYCASGTQNNKADNTSTHNSHLSPNGNPCPYSFPSSWVWCNRNNPVRAPVPGFLHAALCWWWPPYCCNSRRLFVHSDYSNAFHCSECPPDYSFCY
jgi:hypothetical protein